MSRTHRNQFYSKCALRKPKTTQEIRQLYSLIEDTKFDEYELSGLNRMHHRISILPTHYDDIVISAYYEKV